MILKKRERDVRLVDFKPICVTPACYVVAGHPWYLYMELSRGAGAAKVAWLK